MAIVDCEESHVHRAESRRWNAHPAIPDPVPPGVPIAAFAHFMGFLLIGAGVAAMGFMAQHAPSADAATAGQLASHGHAVQVYLSAICMDWALLYYCWVGVHRRGGTFATLSGGRWPSARELLVDCAIAVPFWIVWEGAALGVTYLLGPSSAKTVDSLLPVSPVEVLVWAATCITAGVCEEIGFRGYVQRQLRAFTRSGLLAVVGQGLVFGLFHLYQGWKNVIVISVLGILYGLLANWRRNLRANIISHAMTDLWEGWLKFLVWPM
jgi:membrane protease YdiL (CAAX protease family)